MANPDTPHLVRRQIVALKEESDEGTYEALAAADAGLTVFDANFTLEPRIFDRKPVKDGLSTLAPVEGGLLGRITFRTEFHGQGGGVTTAPEFGQALIAAGHQEVVLNELDCSASTGTPVLGEKLVQDTTSAEAYLIEDGAGGGAGTIWITEPVGSEDNSNNWVGQTSSATFTPNTALPQSNKGFCYRPDSNSKSYSVGLWKPYGDGTSATFSTIKGARGTVSLSANIGETAFLEFEFLGVMNDVADDTTPGSITYDDYTALPFLGANFRVVGAPVANILFSTLSFDTNHTLTARDDANNAAGYKSVKITDRDPQGTFDPELMPVGMQDFYSELDNGTSGEMSFKLGSTSNNIAQFAAGNSVYRAYGHSDRNGIISLDMGFSVHRVGSDEDNEYFYVVR